MTEVQKWDKAWGIALVGCLCIEDIHEITSKMLLMNKETPELRNAQWYSSVSSVLPAVQAGRVFMAVTVTAIDIIHQAPPESILSHCVPQDEVPA